MSDYEVGQEVYIAGLRGERRGLVTAVKRKYLTVRPLIEGPGDAEAIVSGRSYEFEIATGRSRTPSGGSGIWIITTAEHDRRRHEQDLLSRLGTLGFQRVDRTVPMSVLEAMVLAGEAATKEEGS